MASPSWPQFLEEVLATHDSNCDEVIRYTLLKTGGRWSNQPADPVRVLKTLYLGKGADAQTLWPDFRPLPVADWTRSIKSGSRLSYQMGLEEAKTNGFHDALFSDCKGRLLETSTGNLLLLLDGRWVTPSLELGLLAGTARAWLLEADLIEEGEPTLTDLSRANGVAVTNAVKGIVPIEAVGSTSFPTAPALALSEQAGPRHYEAPQA